MNPHSASSSSDPRTAVAVVHLQVVGLPPLDTIDFPAVERHARPESRYQDKLQDVNLFEGGNAQREQHSVAVEQSRSNAIAHQLRAGHLDSSKRLELVQRHGDRVQRYRGDLKGLEVEPNRDSRGCLRRLEAERKVLMFAVFNKVQKQTNS